LEFFRDGKSSFLIKVSNNNRLLCFPDRAGYRAFDRDFAGGFPLAWLACFDQVQSHYVSVAVMQHHAQITEVKQVLESTSEVVKQSRKLAM
jgi:hypothetical protein